MDGETGEVQTLVDSIAIQAGQEKLRQIAQRNLEAVRESGVDAPHARELVNTIWMRSMSPGKTAGGTPAELHLDITRGAAIDDNAFQAELASLIENSVNIHGDGVPGGPLWFGINENPRSKVRACAKNGKLWHAGAVPTTGLTVYPGKDIAHIRNTLRHIFATETTQPPSRVIILGPNWRMTHGATSTTQRSLPNGTSWFFWLCRTRSKAVRSGSIPPSALGWPRTFRSAATR